MIKFQQGNLLEAPTEALVNTVNTVGVMGKGIALMFKEAFPENFRAYEQAVSRDKVHLGEMFITRTNALHGPKWLINFPTKKHWRNPSKLDWIVSGLEDLRRVLIENKIESVALPPLGCGNGGLDWREVKPLIEHSLGSIPGLEVLVFEPTDKYQNVAKRHGVKELTPARALVAEMIRRYWVLGIDCTLLEVQKLCWFLERTIEEMGFENPLQLRFVADKYGPYSDRLRHLLDGLDGSYLHCDKRLSDAGPSDTIWFDLDRKEFVDSYLKQQTSLPLIGILDRTAERIDGFESPLGMELLATADWLIQRESCQPTLESLRQGISRWPAGPQSAERKQKLFTDRLLTIAIRKLQGQGQLAYQQGQ